MPQMSPYNWLILNIMMIIIFIVYITLFYFNYMNKNITSNSMKTSENKFIMKW